MINKIFSAIAALALVASVGVTTAAADTATTATPPNVYVRNVHLDKNVYKAGETVTGSFLLINGDDTSLSDLVYTVSLTGGYDKNGQLVNVYNSQTFTAPFLHAHEQKIIPISYITPKAFSGTNLDIHVQAFQKSGTPLGWGDALITVTDGLPTLSVDKALITVDSKQYAIDAGPMIYNTTKTATVSVNLSNPSSSVITITPRIRIYNRTLNGTPLKDYQVQTVVIKPKDKITLTYPLDTLSYKAGVYVGELSFNDAAGINRALDVQYRYIVSGNIITITSVTTSAAQQAPVAKGDAIPVTIGYTGSPYDIQTGAVAGSGSAVLDVKLFNEKDALVGTYSDTTDFNTGNSKTVTITANTDAKALRAEVTATQNGTVVASYSTKLSGNYDSAKIETATNNDATRIKTVAYGVAGVVIIIALIALIIKLLGARRTKTMMAILALCATGLFMFMPQAQAYTVTTRQSVNAVWDYTNYDFLGCGLTNNNCYPPNNGRVSNWPTSPTGNLPQGYTNTDSTASATVHWHISGCTDASHCSDYSPQVTINTPGTTDVLSPGQSFDVTGSAYASACINNPQDMNVSVTLQTQSGTVLQTYSYLYTNTNSSSGTGHYQVTGGTNFSIPNQTQNPGVHFTAPSTPGTYVITFRVDNYQNVPGRTLNLSSYQSKHPGGTLSPATMGGYLIGTMNITVGGQAPVVTMSADSNPVNYNTGTTVRWSATNSPTSCTASDGFSGSVAAPSGSYATGNLTVSTKYTVTCTNAYGSGSNSVVVSVNAPSQSCTITSSAGAGGTINPLGATSVAYNGSQTFTATANAGYTLSSLIVDGSTPVANPYTFTGVTQNHTIAASFAAVQQTVYHTITASAAPNGSISPSGSVQVQDGGSQTFYITPDPGYNADVQTSQGNPGDVSSYTFTNVTQDQSIYANFVSQSSPTGTDTGSPVVMNTSGHRSAVADILLAQATPCSGSTSVTPTVTLYVTPTTINSGSSSLLTWYSNNATSCTSDTGVGYTSFATGNATTNSTGVSTGAITNTGATSITKTYKINCTNSTWGTTGSATATLTISPAAQNPGTFTGTCRPTTTGHDPASSSKQGDLVTWVASNVTPAGATVSWAGDDVTGTPTGLTFAITYTVIGLKTMRMTITANGVSTTTACINSPYAVKKNPLFIEI